MVETVDPVSSSAFVGMLLTSIGASQLSPIKSLSGVFVDCLLL